MRKKHYQNPFDVYTSVNSGKNPRPLEWDESAFHNDGGSGSSVEGFFDQERSQPNLRWLAAALAACFLVVAFRLSFLQLVKGGSFAALSEDNRIRSQSVLAPRGIISDRYGAVLAQNTASFNLVAVPFDLPKQGLGDEVAKLAEAFSLDPSEIAQKLASSSPASFDPVVISQDMKPEQNILFQTRASDFLGFSMQSIPIRQYPGGEAFAHVLGFTGLISPSETSGIDRQSYDVNDYIGKSGVEQAYEKYLHGANGENQVEVDAAGKLLDLLGEKSPLPGDQLTLNIDKGLQEKLYGELKGKAKGAAVALNPKTGEVLALMSLPGFDNNLFAHGIRQADYDNLLKDKDLPLFDRAISGTYPPGSSSKPMTAVAGLNENIITPDTIIVDNGDLVVPNQFDPSQQYDFRGWKSGGLGPMTVRSAIAQSSDIFFYELAGGSPNGSIAGIGADKLASYFREFGLGKTLGIDIPGEKPGLVPDPAWKMARYNNDPLQGKWFLGDTYHLGIGQGDLLATPLQVAEWTAIVANGGFGYVPQVAQKAVSRDGKLVWQDKPKLLVSGIAPKSVFSVVQQGMRQTVLAGTARALSTLPISSAGKTGTSQFDGSNPQRTHAWFTAYAPYEDPQIVITVLVEAGGEGNAAAEPVVKDALQWWAENRYNK